MRIHSATMPLCTFELREVCYEGALERCCLVVGRLRPDIVKVAEQPPSVTTSTTMAEARHIFDFRFQGKRLLAAVKPAALVALSGINRMVSWRVKKEFPARRCRPRVQSQENRGDVLPERAGPEI